MKVFDVEAEFTGDGSDLKQVTKDAVKDVEDVQRAAESLGKTSEKAASKTDKVEKSLKKTSKAAKATAVETRNLSQSMNVAGQRVGAMGSTIGALGSVARSGATDIGALAGAGGNLAAVFSMGRLGPWLAGITLVAGGIQLIVTKYMEAKKAAVKLRAEAESLNDELALESVRSIGNENERLMAKNKALRAQQSAVDVGGGVSTATVQEALRLVEIKQQVRDLEADITLHRQRQADFELGAKSALTHIAERQAERAVANRYILEGMEAQFGILQMEAAQLPEIVTENDKLRRSNEAIEKSLKNQAAAKAAYLEKLKQENELLKASFTSYPIPLRPETPQGLELLERDFVPDNNELNPADPFLEPAEATKATAGLELANLNVNAGLLASASGLEHLDGMGVEATRSLGGLSREVELSLGAVRNFSESLKDVTARGIDSFMAMLTDGSLLDDVARGRGGEAVGTQVGVVAGGVVGSLFGGAAVGEAIGGVLGSIMGEALDELVESMGILAPLFDTVAVIIRALSPVLMVVGLLFDVIGRTLEFSAPIIHQWAKIFAGVLLFAVRVFELLLPVVELWGIAVSFVTTQFDFFTIALGAVDFVMRALVNTWVSVVLAFGGLHDLIIDKMRELTGFENFGTKLDLDPRDYNAEDLLARINGDEDGDDRTQALDANTEALREFGRSLTNIPSGYRVPLAEYRAETPDGNGGVTFTGAVTLILDKIDSPTIIGEIGRQRGYPVQVGRGRSGN